jgi:transposase
MRIRNTCRAGSFAQKGNAMGKSIQRKSGSRARASQGLPTIKTKVAGIDIGSRQMHVCGPSTEEGQPRLAVFETTTSDIQRCGEWLKELGVESVAMESTGVYWIAPFEILEGQGFEVLLVDTRPLSRVPGRKTDVTDSEWIQKLHSCGLLQGCFRPSDTISELRSIIRMKATLVSEQADWERRMQKCLDQMNVRVHHAVSKLHGTTGLSIIRAIVSGERDAQKLAEHRDPRCRKSKEEISEYLNGNWRQAHLFNLSHCLAMFDLLSEKLNEYELEIHRRLRELTPEERKDEIAPPLPSKERMKGVKKRGLEEKRQELFRMVGVDITTIDGISVETAEAIVSEYGPDLGKFDQEKQFISHLQLAPRRAISGGKQLPKAQRKTTGTRAGRALRMAATSLRQSSSALGAYYRRISRSKGASVAVFATARKMATLVYRLLRLGKPYLDEGQAAYEARHQANRLRLLVATASQFGLQVIPKLEGSSA